MARVYALSTFYKDKGSLYDKDFLNDPKMRYNVAIDEFEKMGIEAFGEKGESFDPQIHNAIMHEENPDMQESVISEVFQRGYRKGDKIIRCAMVKVVN